MLLKNLQISKIVCLRHPYGKLAFIIQKMKEDYLFLRFEAKHRLAKVYFGTFIFVSFLRPERT